MALGYDLVIIGGGTAGLTAAKFAAQIGASVAIVEKSRIGGDCTWTGCVPSKTLLKAAKVAHEMRTASRFGIKSAEPQVNLAQVMSHVKKVVSEVYQHESPDILRESGIDIFTGQAQFDSPNFRRQIRRPDWGKRCHR